MNRKIFKTVITLFAAVLCMAAFSITALADGGEDWCEYGDYDEDAGSEESTGNTETPDISGIKDAVTGIMGGNSLVVKMYTEPVNGNTGSSTSGSAESTPGKPLTPTGNLTLVDDTYQVNGENVDPDGLVEKQFITVQSKNGNFFYIIIDRCGDTENVYFLNQIDEADLMALMEDPEAEPEEPPVCICADKCAAGSINLNCPVCQATMSECQGREPEPEPEPEPEEPEEPQKTGNMAILLVVLVMALAGGGALYYFKFRKPAPDTKGPVDLDDYDFGEDDDEDYEYEQDDEAEAGAGAGKTGAGGRDG